MTKNTEPRTISVTLSVAHAETLLRNAGVAIGKNGSTYYSFQFADGHRERTMTEALQYLLDQGVTA